MGQPRVPRGPDLSGELASPSMAGSRSFWGWGFETEHLSSSEQHELGTLVAPLVGVDALEVIGPPSPSEITLPASRLTPPSALAVWSTTDDVARAGHTYGKSFRDVVRGL